MFNNKLTAGAIANAAALLMAPAAGAHKPFKEPLGLEASVIDTCPFDVGIEPDGGNEFMTIFDSGRLTIHARLQPTLTNLETGFATSVHQSYLFSQTFDADANELDGRVTGRSLFALLPGDVGPSGDVDPDGGLVRVVGQLSYTMDPETGAITSMSVRGELTDMCTLLAS
jgi:hypothetical protein